MEEDMKKIYLLIMILKNFLRLILILFGVALTL